MWMDVGFHWLFGWISLIRLGIMLDTSIVRWGYLATHDDWGALQRAESHQLQANIIPRTSHWGFYGKIVYILSIYLYIYIHIYIYIYTYTTYINGIKLVIFQQAMICNWLKLTNQMEDFPMDPWSWLPEGKKTWFKRTTSREEINTWRFPEIEVPPSHHPFNFTFSRINHPAIGVPPF